MNHDSPHKGNHIRPLKYYKTPDYVYCFVSFSFVYYGIFFRDSNKTLQFSSPF